MQRWRQFLQNVSNVSRLLALLAYGIQSTRPPTETLVHATGGRGRVWITVTPASAVIDVKKSHSIISYLSPHKVKLANLEVLLAANDPLS